MALSPTEEAQTRDLIAQQAALLSLAGVEPTILSKLGAAKVTLSDLPTASAINDADLLLLRQGVTDKSVTGATIKGLIPPAGATLQDNKFTGLQTFADEVAVASASTINLTTVDSNNIEITGTTTITAVTMPEGSVIKARASGAFQLTNSSSLIVQGGANYTTTVNDILTFTKDGAGNVHVEISKSNGQAVTFSFASEAEYETGTDTTKSLNPAVARAKNLVLKTAIATTSGTSHDFTGIPSWVKRITFEIISVSTNGASSLLFQLGDSGGIEASGYLAHSGAIQSGAGSTTAEFTTGFGLGDSNSSAFLHSGSFALTLVSGTTWVMSGSARQAANRALFAAGEKTLSGTLDRVRLTTVNGTDVFDAGSFNIIYE